MENRKLIKSAAVLSMDPQVGNQLNYDILIEGDKIVQVARGIYDAGAEEIDGSGMLAMPGFVDAHHHMWLGVLRNMGAEYMVSQQVFDGTRQATLADSFSPEDVYASTLASAINAIDAGITTVLDHANLPTADHLAANAKALAEAGLRTVLAAPANLGKAGLEELHASLPAERSRLALASSDPQTSSLADLQSEWELARSLSLRISAQVGMGTKPGDQLSELNKAKLLGPDLMFAHGNTLSDRDLSAIRDARAAVASAPAAEMMQGYGAPTVQRFLDAGLNPGLGIDTEIANRGDMFSQMRNAISMQHAMRFDKKLAGSIFADRMMTTRDIIQFVNVYGAQTLGMQDEIGTLTPGKQADIVLLRQHHINVMPVNDPIGAVVWAMDCSNIDSVMVAGKFLKRHGELLNCDLARLQALTGATRERVLGVAAPA
ncbi:MAG: amidohydrolase family protein [Anaerolineales bacterium]|nr:MAG: amidohydrolase family protein [Anaerolineales bacterium]